MGGCHKLHALSAALQTVQGNIQRSLAVVSPLWAMLYETTTHCTFMQQHGAAAWAVWPAQHGWAMNRARVSLVGTLAFRVGGRPAEVSHSTPSKLKAL